MDARRKVDKQTLEQINDLGGRLTELLNGYSIMVVLNITALMFAGACKAAGLEPDEIAECVKFGIEQNSAGEGLLGKAVWPH